MGSSLVQSTWTRVSGHGDMIGELVRMVQH
jgi:hypothetical protein